MKDLRNTLCLVAATTAIVVGACASSDAGPHPPGPGSSAGGQHGDGDGVDTGTTVDLPAVDDSTRLSGDAANPPEVMADAATDPGPPSGGGGACSSLFCEDFEGGMIDPARWSAQMGGAGTLEVQQQIVAHGKHAYHVHGSGASGDFAMIIVRNAPMALRGPGPLSVAPTSTPARTSARTSNWGSRAARATRPWPR